MGYSHVRYSEFTGTDTDFSLALDLYRNECIWFVELILILLRAKRSKYGQIRQS